MIKKILSLALLIIIGMTLSACKEEITLTIETESITLIEGATHQIDWETNDIDGIDFSSMDNTIVSVSASGLITALGEGETTIEMRSLTDDSVSVTVTIIVR